MFQISMFKDAKVPVLPYTLQLVGWNNRITSDFDGPYETVKRLVLTNSESNEQFSIKLSSANSIEVNRSGLI